MTNDEATLPDQEPLSPGAGMAANLLKAGREVAVYNRTPAKAEALVAQGAKAAAGVADTWVATP